MALLLPTMPPRLCCSDGSFFSWTFAWANRALLIIMHGFSVAIIWTSHLLNRHVRTLIAVSYIAAMTLATLTGNVFAQQPLQVMARSAVVG
jgi:hypothetical protein